MQILNIFHVLVAIAMVALILVQRGPGATAGAAFGSGASGTVFGSRGAGSFLSRSTWTLATLFCLISLVMAVMVSRDLSTPDTDLGVVGGAPTVTQPVEELENLAPVMDDPATDIPALDMGLLEGEDSTGAATDLPEPDANPDAGEQGPGN